LAPYRPPGVDTIINGEKHTTTYAINARTGTIERVFSATGMSGLVGDRKCRTHTQLADMKEECDSTEGSDKIIMLGRTGTYLIPCNNLVALFLTSQRIYNQNPELVYR
jgi:serine/threonine-protein kinase/endoribonuclease IRE1